MTEIQGKVGPNQREVRVTEGPSYRESVQRCPPFEQLGPGGDLLLPVKTCLPFHRLLFYIMYASVKQCHGKRRRNYNLHPDRKSLLTSLILVSSTASLRTADVSARSSPLRDVSRGRTSFLLAKRTSAAMSEENVCRSQATPQRFFVPFFMSLWEGALRYDTKTAVKQTTPDQEFCSIEGCFFIT